MKIMMILTALMFLLSSLSFSQQMFEKDTVRTSAGNLEITFIGHGTLMFRFNNLVIHVDPVSREADYSDMPKADLILITHDHPDHLDPGVIKVLSKKTTKIILTKSCAEKLGNGTVMKNGDELTIKGIKIKAIPAYNLVHKRKSGEFFHPKGVGNGYVITFGDKRIYIAGDTENIPEMKNLKNIDVAFLPMNLPYTMTPAMVADAAKAFKPKVLYPYHYGDTDPQELVNLLKADTTIRVLVRKMQ